MTLPHPRSFAVTGVLALLWFVSLLPAAETPPVAPAPSAAGKALDAIEATAPKTWLGPEAARATQAQALALIEANTLQSGEDFRRAANFFQSHLGEYRIGRVAYELTLAAVAQGDEGAEKMLGNAWDNLLWLTGHAIRFDPYQVSQAHPDQYLLDAPPACIRAVWTDPAGARAKLLGATDNPEIKTLVDADQADRSNTAELKTQEDFAALAARDSKRLARMREIVDAGDLHTTQDFARAALVLQHSFRFDGFQLAHELAVCATLLGDRGQGRWLVAASYDRLLNRCGHDQRFGTQFGSAGLMPIDEAGICDHERTALGCRTLAETRSLSPNGPARKAGAEAKKS